MLGLGDPDVAEPIEQPVDRHPPFGTGERCAGTGVDAVPERDVLAGVHAAEVERVWIGEHPLVAIAHPRRQHQRSAGGDPDGGLGTDGDLVGAAIAAADQGDGAIVLCDLGSAILTARAVLEEQVNGNGSIRLVDAPLVEGAIAAAVVASAGMALDAVVSAAEEARAVPKF